MKDRRIPLWSVLVIVPAVVFLTVLVEVFWKTALASSRSETALSHKSELQEYRKAQEEYVNHISVRNIHVTKSLYGWSGSAELKNTGNRTVDFVKVTLYYLGRDGRPVYEQREYPINTLKTPLRPGYSRRFEVELHDPPSDWDQKLTMTVSDIDID
jgi:hypothetical protein